MLSCLVMFASTQGIFIALYQLPLSMLLSVAHLLLLSLTVPSFHSHAAKIKLAVKQRIHLTIAPTPTQIKLKQFPTYVHHLMVFNHQQALQAIILLELLQEVMEHSKVLQEVMEHSKVLQVVMEHSKVLQVVMEHSKVLQATILLELPQEVMEHSKVLHLITEQATLHLEVLKEIRLDQVVFHQMEQLFQELFQETLLVKEAKGHQVALVLLQVIKQVQVEMVKMDLQQVTRQSQEAKYQLQPMDHSQVLHLQVTKQEVQDQMVSLASQETKQPHQAINQLLLMEKDLHLLAERIPPLLLQALKNLLQLLHPLRNLEKEIYSGNLTMNRKIKK